MMWRYYVNKKRFMGRNVIEKSLGDGFWKWLVSLRKFHDIYIRNFEYLFSQIDNISFPVKVKMYSDLLSVTDNDGRKFKLNFIYYDDKSMRNFTISQISEDILFAQTFSLSPNKMKLVGLSYSPSKISQREVKFQYDTESTTATLNLFDYSLSVIYPHQESELDNKVLEYLWNVEQSEKFFYDLFPSFNFLLQFLQSCHNILITSCYSQASKDQLLSEIDLSNGIVTKYSYTEKKSHRTLCLYQMTISKSVEEFLHNPKR